MSHVLRYAARTDRGLLRANNQDSVYAGDRLLIIADGMGGHAAGDVASRLVVAAFMPLDELPLGVEMRQPLVDATHEGNAAIAEMVDENPEFDGMGTTLTALLFDGPQVALAHVGDSRAYLYRNDVLHQISHDDTFVQSLVDDGRITADEAAHHPQRSLLLRALNGSSMDPAITFREIAVGDRFLICSDGLSDYVSPESIADTIAGEDPDQVADTLIQLALVAGGPDNVTVIVADVVETGAQPVSPTGLAAATDPEATGPMQAIHLTQEFPRVPLPPIPEEPAARPDFAVDAADDLDDDLDDELELDDEELDETDDAERSMISAPARPRRGRKSAFALALVVLVGVALTGTYLWAHSKYYVGSDNGQVVVFRGVDGSLLGVRFASVQENSCSVDSEPGCPMQVMDLQPDARDLVNAGITVGSLTEARGVISTLLTNKRLPVCAVESPATTGAGTAGSSPSGSGIGTDPSASNSSSIVPTLSITETGSGTGAGTSSGPGVGSGTSDSPTGSSGLASTVSFGPGTGIPAVTTTVLITVSPGTAFETATSEGQRLRVAPVATSRVPASPVRTVPRTTPRRTTPARTTPRPTAPSTPPSQSVASASTVTVFSTVTAAPTTLSSTDSSSAISLTSQTQEPGVNCRSPR